MIRKTNNPVTPLIISLIVLLSSCGRDIVFTDSVAMPEKTWSLSEITEFNVPVTDSLNSTDVIFTIRTGSDFPFGNIFLFVTTTSPDGNSMTDTLEYKLADSKGNWYGKGSGDIHELELPYKTNVFFPGKGIYNFKIQHGMRTVNLKGVYDFGLTIKKFTGKE